MEPMTSAELKAAEKLCAEATPGPWTCSKSKSADKMTKDDVAICAGPAEPGSMLGMIGEVWAERVRYQPDARVAIRDASFIVAARIGWPAALAEVRQLRSILAQGFVATTYTDEERQTLCRMVGFTSWAEVEEEAGQ